MNLKNKKLLKFNNNVKIVEYKLSKEERMMKCLNSRLICKKVRMYKKCREDYIRGIKEIRKLAENPILDKYAIPNVIQNNNKKHKMVKFNNNVKIVEYKLSKEERKMKCLNSRLICKKMRMYKKREGYFYAVKELSRKLSENPILDKYAIPNVIQNNNEIQNNNKIVKFDFDINTLCSILEKF